MHVVLLAALLSANIGAPADPAAAVPDPSKLVASVMAYESAANRHDWEAVRPLMAEDAVIDLGGDLAIVGRDGARALHEWERAMRTEIHYTGCVAAGQTVTCRATEQNDFLRVAGLGAIEYSASTITFHDGRVARMSATLSDESGQQVSGYMQSFLEWATRLEPKAVATFLKPDGSFTFGFESAMTFKRLVRLYALTHGGGVRAL